MTSGHESNCHTIQADFVNATNLTGAGGAAATAASCGSQFDIGGIFGVNKPILLTSDFHSNQKLTDDADSFGIDAVHQESVNGGLFIIQNTLHADNVTTDDNSISYSTEICNQSRPGSDVGGLGEPGGICLTIGAIFISRLPWMTLDSQGPYFLFIASLAYAVFRLCAAFVIYMRSFMMVCYCRLRISLKLQQRHATWILVCALLFQPMVECNLQSTSQRDARSHVRQLQESAEDCADGAAFAARSAAVMRQCCPPQPYGGTPNCQLPSVCDQNDCANEYLRFFNDCNSQLNRFPQEQLQLLQDFNAACETYAGGIGVTDAVVLSANDLAPPPCEDTRESCATLVAAGRLSCETDLCPTCALAHQCDLNCNFCDSALGGEDGPLLLCFDVTCNAPSIQEQGTIISAGCDDAGALGTSCRLGCSTGYDESDVSDGSCAARWLADEQIAVAEYSGQTVTCSPARNADGSLSESFCRMQLAEVILDCCGMVQSGNQETTCGTQSPPTACSLGCAERWLPLVEDCDNHLADFQQLTAACEDQALALVGEAPSTVSVSGMSIHVDGNGLYSIASRTIGGHPYWTKEAGAATQPNWYLYWVNEPHDGWALGTSLTTNAAMTETYEGPPWGQHPWLESTNAVGSTTTVHIMLDPGYSDSECAETLSLLSSELTETCTKLRMQEDGSYTTRQTFEQLLAAGGGPNECGFDCAATWYQFSADCDDFLTQRYPGLAAFTALCSATHDAMTIYDVDSTLVMNGHDDHYFDAQQGLVYQIEEVPGTGLERTALGILAEGTSHPLAERLDLTRTGAGQHMLEWNSPRHEAGMDIDVDALEGAGDYHLQARIVGTTERLSREVVPNRPVLLQIECRLFDDCTYRYSGLEMRSDGSSFPLKFNPTGGFTYNITVALRNATGSAAHLRFAVYPVESISVGGEENIGGTTAMEDCDLSVHTNTDTGQINVGSWAAPSQGRQSWGEAKCANDGHQDCCADPTQVGPPGTPCSGSYQHFPGQSFPTNGAWNWTCAYTGEYILLVTANCDVNYYADPWQPGCTQTADGLDCRDDDIERCATGLDLTITTTDAQVHVKRTFELHTAAMSTSEVDAQLAAMFATSQQSALSFPTTITRFDCDVPEHHSRPICQRVGMDGPDGGHRRDLGEQLTICTQNEFSAREVQMLDACTLTGESTSDASALQQSMCPSLACAETLTSLLDDCSESIDHLDDCSAAAVDCSVLSGVDCASQAERCQQSTLHKQYYAEMQRSAMYAGCAEMEQNHAQFAAVEVQVRAPSLEAVDQIMEAHQVMADMFNQPGGCSGRRVLRDAEARCAAELLTERNKIRRLEAELSKAKRLLERSNTVIRHKDERIAELETQPVEIREAKAGNRRSNRRRQQQEQEAGQALVMMQRADGAPTMCATAPCELDGACMHGGTCSPLPEDSREGAFLCSCVVGYDGSHCEMDIDECASTPCQNNGACFESSDLDAVVPLDAYVCSCVDGYSGGNCRRLGYANVSNCVAGLARGMETCSVYLEESTTELGTISVNAGKHFEIHGNQGGAKLRLLADFGVNGALILADLQMVGGSGDAGQMIVETGGELTFERVQMQSGSLTVAGVVYLMETSLVEVTVTASSGSELTFSGGTVARSTVTVSSGRMTVDTGCVLTDSPISASGFGGSVTISGAELQSDGSSVPLTVEADGAAMVTATTFRSNAGDITAVSMAEGGRLTVGGSQLVGVDGSADPFPCDGTLPDCVGDHDGSVVVEGPASINTAAPLVCADESARSCLSGYVEMSNCLADIARGMDSCFVYLQRDTGALGTISVDYGEGFEIHGNQGEPKLRLLADFGVGGVLLLADLTVVGGSGNGCQMSIETTGELTFERVEMEDGRLTFAGVVSLMESSLLEVVVTGSSGSELSLSGGTVTGSTLTVNSGRVAIDGGCVLADSPVSITGAGGSVTIAGAELQSDSSSVPSLTVESDAAATVTGVTFRSTAGDITAVSVAEHGSLTVGRSQLVKADGSVDPFPCDGTLPDCAGEHDGSVVVEGPSAINMAAPLVCDTVTGECLSDLCFVVDCGVGGTCVSPYGTCTCHNGYSGERCDTHVCCSGVSNCDCGDYCRSSSCGDCLWYAGDTCTSGNPMVCSITCCGAAWCDAHRPGWDTAEIGVACDRGC